MQEDMKRIFVTGANQGIGFALCKQLILENGCFVYMGSRNKERGQNALMELGTECDGKVQLLQIDVSDDESVKKAAEELKSMLGQATLYALVNNAGTGLNHGVSSEALIQTNYYGVQRVTEAFLPLINKSCGRIINVGSGAGPIFVSKQEEETQKFLIRSDCTKQEIDEFVCKTFPNVKDDGWALYGMSKASLNVYTAVLASSHPNLQISVVSPGFINTAMTKGYGATLQPEQGTVSIKHCLFNHLKGNGWYYGSDAIRSPLHFMRNPGEPAFEGY